MVKIRLKRVGKANQPSYRVVVADSRRARDGRIIEAIGVYGPRQDPSEIAIENDRALYWLQRGAQPSDAVRKLLEITGAWSQFTGETAPTTAATPPRATPAASVDKTPGDDEGEEPAVVPEAEDHAAAAPDSGSEDDRR